MDKEIGAPFREWLSILWYILHWNIMMGGLNKLKA